MQLLQNAVSSKSSNGKEEMWEVMAKSITPSSWSMFSVSYVKYQ